jgi:plastocyanin
VVFVCYEQTNSENHANKEYVLQTSYLILGLALFGILQYAYAESYQVTILPGTSDQNLGLKLYPEILPFKGGDTIVWKNEDSVPHKMTSGIGAHPEYSGKFFKTSEILPGKTGKAKFDVKDNFAFYYFCELHPWLSGKLVVETAEDSQPETSNPISASKNGDSISISGQEHYDFRKTPYDVLIYHGDELVKSKGGLLDETGAFAETIAAGMMSPGRYTIKAVYGLPTQVAITNIEINSDASIPKWIRIDAKWWADGTITDSEFVKAIEYLAKEKIIKIQKADSTNDKVIPTWLKSSAGWWASGQITDSEFTKSLQYLSNAGIIQI